MDPLKPKHEEAGVNLQRVLEGIVGKEKKKRRKNSRGTAPKTQSSRPRKKVPVSRWAQLGNA